MHPAGRGRQVDRHNAETTERRGRRPVPCSAQTRADVRSTHERQTHGEPPSDGHEDARTTWAHPWPQGCFLSAWASTLHITTATTPTALAARSPWRTTSTSRAQGFARRSGGPKVGASSRRPSLDRKRSWPQDWMGPLRCATRRTPPRREGQRAPPPHRWTRRPRRPGRRTSLANVIGMASRGATRRTVRGRAACPRGR